MKKDDRSGSNVANESSTTPEDYILQLHNSAERLSKEEIARRYSQHFWHRESADADLEFVDRVLTNREG